MKNRNAFVKLWDGKIIFRKITAYDGDFGCEGA